MTVRRQPRAGSRRRRPAPSLLPSTAPPGLHIASWSGPDACLTAFDLSCRGWVELDGPWSKICLSTVISALILLALDLPLSVQVLLAYTEGHAVAVYSDTSIRFDWSSCAGRSVVQPSPVCGHGTDAPSSPHSPSRVHDQRQLLLSSKPTRGKVQGRALLADLC